LQQRDDAEWHVGLLVVELEGEQALTQRVVAEDCPAGALQAVGGGGELCLELVERAELVVDGCGEFTGGLVAASLRPFTYVAWCLPW
jgi:hypothetical protein